MINTNGVLDKVLFAIFNNDLKAFNLVAAQDAQSGDIGTETNVDEAMTLALDGITSKLRINLSFSVLATITGSKPVPKAGEVILWKDTTLTKYYILVNFGTDLAPVVKAIELV
jgi:hypothetical protein